MEKGKSPWQWNGGFQGSLISERLCLLDDRVQNSKGLTHRHANLGAESCSFYSWGGTPLAREDG